MEIIPAIDIRGGKVVRLYQGDYGKETVYGEDPVAAAVRWQEEGAPRIHVVDLDGARSGQPENLASIKSILDEVDVPVQVGGGIRSLETAEKLLDEGVQRVVFGTAAVRDPDLVAKACAHLGGDAVVVGVDARDGMVAVEGWTEGTSIRAEALVRAMARAGVRRFIFTDISTDSTLRGPNLAAAEALMKVGGGIHVVYSGGIATLKDLVQLDVVGVEGVIVGSALYKGALRLREAVERFSR
ncbi:MAG: 1-(5-phosphoribosyl)-5-[(5-phosphoribosylamino)methylideneamino]imidazole-4-carboxamide isomerase [Chloroflexi bacterium]|nr:1-(5-phosphoribosyl)-5-[(5-phosphoribosylamino)methylideneamino]imidazole-4-carboxamide isomerase [Chloroflexota bacterium]